MRVVGVQQRSGEYQGNKYDNFLIHCLKEDDDCLGEISEIVKVKASKVKEIFGRQMQPEDWQNLIGKEIRQYCDKYGQTIEVRVVEPEPAKKAVS